MIHRREAGRRTARISPRPPASGGIALLSGLLLAAGCSTDEGARAGDVEETVRTASVEFDWMISGGEVIDGTGAPPRTADVLVRDGRIVFVGVVDPDTLDVDRIFDAAGRVVTPGFIDVHAHGDPLETPTFENFLAQGVTTILLGQDGSSPPARELGRHLESLERVGPAVNVGYLVGHNTILGEAAPGTGEGYGALTALVETALEAGAFGLSLGLEYTPGRLSTMEELVAIAEPVGRHDGVVMSHMRTEDSGDVMGAVEELLEQGRRSGARVHASHLKVVLGADPAEGQSVLDAMAAARAEGMQVTGEVYPYLASFTGIAILFPDWARSPNDYEAVKARRGDELAGYLRDRVMARNGPGATLFGTGPFAGRTLEQVSTEQDRPFEDLLVELGPGGARAAYFVMDEAVMTTFLRDPHVAIASDGSPTMGHPRGYGSFARVIRRHVVEEGTLSLEEAVRKMTGLPATIIGVDDPDRVAVARGLIREGWAADLAVFDPSELVDRADYENPHRLAHGMAAVWVNGQLALDHAEPVHTAGAGHVLRRESRPSGPGPDENTENVQAPETTRSAGVLE